MAVGFFGTGARISRFQNRVAGYAGPGDITDDIQTDPMGHAGTALPRCHTRHDVVIFSGPLCGAHATAYL
jgi:hypothetical protein